MQKQQNHLGQISEYWLTQRAGSAAWYRTWFDQRSRQTVRSSLGTKIFKPRKSRSPSS